MIYVHKCNHKGCKSRCEENYPMKFVGREHELPQHILYNITCTKHGVMPRVPQVPHLIGARGSEKQLLKKKQQQRKLRSKLHFKNEIMPTLKDPVDRGYFKHKFEKGANKGLKGDHEKMK